MPSFRPYPVMTIATLVALIILVALGNWQMRRLAWKEDLIAQVTTRADLPPVALEDALASGEAADLSYTPVAVRGRFDHAREVQVFGQNLDGYAGYFVYTPLERDGRPTVIVNRGFVPASLQDPESRIEGQVSGDVRVTGLIRTSRTAHAFQPRNDAAAGTWFVPNLDEMATAMGAARVVPVFIDADATPNPGGWPQGGQTRIAFRNSHLGYALTWYGLAVTLLAVYIAVHIGAGRLTIRRST
jgi:surfeit locus 1 family protein